jgi:4-oxalomesaconate tautomerase
MEADSALRARVETIRLEAGKRMQLGDVTKKTVPKMCLVAPARNGGDISTRMFIPHKVHKAIGVFGAVSVATACALPGSIASEIAPSGGDGVRSFEIEHPTGFFTVSMEIESGPSGPQVQRSALLRTARALMTGDIFVPGDVWRKGSL